MKECKTIQGHRSLLGQHKEEGAPLLNVWRADTGGVSQACPEPLGDDECTIYANHCQLSVAYGETLILRDVT